MLQLLLKPGVFIISHLTIARKFIFIFSLYLIPVGYVAYYAITKNQVAMQSTMQETVYLNTISQFEPVFVNMAKARGLTNAFLNGNESARPRISASRGIVDEQLTRLQNDKAFNALKGTQQQQLQEIVSGWSQLKREAFNSEAAGIFARHSELIGKTLHLMRSILESSALQIDPQAETSFLIGVYVNQLPQLVEITGQTRGMGAGVAAKGSFTQESFLNLTAFSSELTRLRQKIADSYSNAARDNSDTRGLLSAQSDLDAKLAAFLQTTSSKLIQPENVLISSDEYFAMGTGVIDSALALYQSTYTKLQNLLEKRHRSIKFEVWLNILSSLGLVASGLYLFACFYRNMQDSIVEIKNSLKAVADGDLTVRANITSNDEMKRIGYNINRMVDKTKSLVTKVHNTTQDLVQTAKTNNTSASETSERINQQNIEVEQVATAMNEMSATVQEVANNAEQTASSTASADRDAKAGFQIVQGTITSISELAAELKNASESINELQDNVNGIGSVLDVIQGIADQTNLLALNAAIEAARAGESGRGFAVVADEVRTLASKTQESTEEIRQMIDKLQSSASTSVRSMKSGNEKSEQTVTDAQQAGAALEKISEQVSHISLMGEQIASAATEQSAVAEEINRSIMSVKDITELTGSAAEESAKNSRFVDEVAHNLEDLVAQFKVK